MCAAALTYWGLLALCLFAAPLELCAAERPLIVAHRGLLHHAPENTLANFRGCLELRLGFEIDVEKTKGGHLVCIHDGMAEKHKVLHRLLFIGKTISETQVRDRIRAASKTAHTAVVANNSEEFPTSLTATNADWVYFRYLPPKGQMEAVRSQGQRSPH